MDDQPALLVDWDNGSSLSLLNRERTTSGWCPSRKKPRAWPCSKKHDKRKKVVTYPIYHPMGRRETGPVPHDHQTGSQPATRTWSTWKCSGAAAPSFSTRSAPSVRCSTTPTATSSTSTAVVERAPGRAERPTALRTPQPGRLQNCPAAAGPVLLQRRHPAGGGFLPSRPPKLRRQRQAVQCRGPEHVGRDSPPSTESPAGSKASPWRKQISASSSNGTIRLQPSFTSTRPTSSPRTTTPATFSCGQTTSGWRPSCCMR